VEKRVIKKKLLFFFCNKTNVKSMSARTPRIWEDTQHYMQVRRRIPDYHAYLVRKLFAPHEGYRVLPNMYPYMPFHRLFWVNPRYSKYYSFTRIKSMVLTLYPHAVHIFENPVPEQSIRTIRHVHFSASPVVDAPK
jgi:hypothetical protein